MSSYEVVRRAIELDGPERLPLHFLLNAESSDVVHVDWNSLDVGDCDLREAFDDWGTQQALMISPDLWREFFRFILSIDDEDEEDLNISPEKTQAMLDAFLKADPWRRK